MEECLYIEGRVSGYFTRKSGYETGVYSISDLSLHSADIRDTNAIADTHLEEHCVGSYYKPTHFHDLRIFNSESEFFKVRLRDFIIRDLSVSEAISADGEKLIPYNGIFIAKISKPLVPKKKEKNKAIEITEDTEEGPSPNGPGCLGRFFGPAIALFRKDQNTVTAPIFSELFNGIVGALIIGLFITAFLSIFSIGILGIFASFYLILIIVVDALFKRFPGAKDNLGVRSPINFLFANILLCYSLYSVFTYGWQFGNFHLFLIGAWLLLISLKSPLLRLLGIGILIFQLIYFINQINDQFKNQKRDQDGSEYIEPDDDTYLPETEIDTASIRINDKDSLNVEYLVHKLNWLDNNRKKHSGVFKVSKDHFSIARLRRENLEVFESDPVSYWHDVYDNLVNQNKEYLDGIQNEYIRIIKKKRLSHKESADMIVTSIQNIPYYLVHDLSHEEANRVFGGFITEYHSTGGPCLSNIKYGLQSPTEFMGNFKGDCDTRSVLLYSVLNKLGFKTIVLASDHYGHAIIGVAGNYSGKSIRYDGIDYYVWETTAKGFRPGVLSDECGNLRYWYVALGN